MNEKKPATFVATTRVSVTDVASIALYIHAQGEFAETRSGVLNMGVKMLASITQQKHPVLNASDAVRVFHDLGYGDVREKGTKYFKALSNDLNEDMKAKERIKNMQSITDIAVAEFRQAEQEQASLDTTIKDTMALAENMTDSPIAMEGSADLADIDQKSSDEARTMRAGLGTPDVEVEEEGDEQDD